MGTLATLKAQDVEPGAPPFDYTSFGTRQAARTVLFDGTRVALLRVNKHRYYMLPGGGLDNGEDLLTALRREILEELGCTVKIIDSIGSITIYSDRWKTKQTDFCYITQRLGTSGRPILTDIERAEGHEVIWASSLYEAAKLMQNAKPENRDGKLVRARDLLFLETAKRR